MEIIGVSRINEKNIIVVRRNKKLGKSNPIAEALRTSKYKQRKVENKKAYNRKKNKTISQKSSSKEF